MAPKFHSKLVSSVIDKHILRELSKSYILHQQPNTYFNDYVRLRKCL